MAHLGMVKGQPHRLPKVPFSSRPKHDRIAIECMRNAKKTAQVSSGEGNVFLAKRCASITVMVIRLGSAFLAVLVDHRGVCL